MVGRKLWIALLAATLLTPLLVAATSDKEDDIQRIKSSTTVFQEIMKTPDKGIPQEILENAACIGIIPGQKKFALGLGGSYGKGLITCRNPRTPSGWSAPYFVTIGGGSFGFQIGGQSADVVMIFQNRRGMESLLSNKFKIGADANAAAGPVGRHAAAGTDVALNAEILTYSRSRGAFAGVSLTGSVVQPDDTGNTAMYGQNVRRKAIITGQVPVPTEAVPLVRDIAKHSPTPAKK